VDWLSWFDELLGFSSVIRCQNAAAARCDTACSFHAAEERVREALRHTVNPGWWAWWLLSSVLRLPFAIVSAAGIKVEKFEAGIGGIIVKVITAIAVAYAIARLGLQEGSGP
jgi:hypothetical protein